MTHLSVSLVSACVSALTPRLLQPCTRILVPCVRRTPYSRTLARPRFPRACSPLPRFAQKKIETSRSPARGDREIPRSFNPSLPVHLYLSPAPSLPGQSSPSVHYSHHRSRCASRGDRSRLPPSCRKCGAIAGSTARPRPLSPRAVVRLMHASFSVCTVATPAASVTTCSTGKPRVLSG